VVCRQHEADRSFRGLEHMIISKSGDTLWMHISGVATWDERGNPTGHRERRGM